MQTIDCCPLDDEAVVTKEICPYQYGQVQYRSSWYLARCSQNISIPLGSFVRVLRYDGIRLVVEPVDRSQTQTIEPRPFFTSVPSSPCGERGLAAIKKTAQAAFLWLGGLLTGSLLIVATPSLFADRSMALPAETPNTQFEGLNWQSEQPQVRAFSFNICKNMEVSPDFCDAWLSEAWQHRRRWRVTGSSLLDSLSGLSPKARSQLGYYTNNGSRFQQRVMRALNLSPKEVGDLTNQRFYSLFPRRRNQKIAPSERMTGQLWLACREDVLREMWGDF